LRLATVQSRFKGVETEVDIPGDLPPVLAEERHLSQVILNLLLNAGDAMEGQGRVRVVGRRVGNRVEVEVSDSGPGIAKEDLPRIFDPFFTTKEPGEGSGLGLAICHSIVESLGGSIDASSGAKGGGVLTIRLRIEGA
jgi:two-component system NtrC family sensor kinase